MTQTAFLNPTRVVATIQTGTIAGERFLVLDSWRGICALLVALFHFPTSSTISQSAFVGSSYLFVDFFFVLSGFVIASSYGNRLNQPDEARSLRAGPLRPHLPAASRHAARLRRLRAAAAGSAATARHRGRALHRRLRPQEPACQSAPAARRRLRGSIELECAELEHFGRVLRLSAVCRRGLRRRRSAPGSGSSPPPSPRRCSCLRFSTHHMDVSFDFGFIRCLYGFSLGALACLVSA